MTLTCFINEILVNFMSYLIQIIQCTLWLCSDPAAEPLYQAAAHAPTSRTAITFTPILQHQITRLLKKWAVKLTFMWKQTHKTTEIIFSSSVVVLCVVSLTLDCNMDDEHCIYSHTHTVRLVVGDSIHFFTACSRQDCCTSVEPLWYV